MDKQKIEIKDDTPRIFTWMPKIDGYVLREFLIPYSTLLFAFTLLFLIADVFNDLGDFLEDKSPIRLVIRYFLLRIPCNIVFILPITVLLSCMYTLANFGRHREITAMRASGISLFRCGRSIFFMAFFTMCVHFWFNESLVPKCQHEAYMIFLSVGNPDYEKKLNSKLQYHSGDNLRSWFFGLFDEDGIQENVKLKFFKEDPSSAKRKLPEKMVEASRAKFVEGKGWEFYDPQIREFTEDGLPGKTYQPKENPLVISEKDLPERPAMIEKAVILPENLSTTDIYMILSGNKKMAKALRNVYMTLFYSRLAFPWLCFLCAFLALPLAAKNERSGIFTAITSAIGVIVLYQVLSEISSIAGKNGVLPPIAAGLGPTIIFAVYAAWLARKAG